MMIRQHANPVAAAQWLLARFYLVQACQYSDVTIGRCEQKLALDRYLLLTVHEGKRMIGAALVELAVGTLHIVLLAGDRFKDWELPMLNTFKEIAMHFNKASITLQGRKGWLRQLAKFGFKQDGDRLRLIL